MYTVNNFPDINCPNCNDLFVMADRSITKNLNTFGMWCHSCKEYGHFPYYIRPYIFFENGEIIKYNLISNINNINYRVFVTKYTNNNAAYIIRKFDNNFQFMDIFEFKNSFINITNIWFQKLDKFMLKLIKLKDYT